MSDLISRQAVLDYPIRLDHYDEEHGNLNFVLGIESVMEYVESLPSATCDDCIWHVCSYNKIDWDALPSAEATQNTKAWNGLYIKVYADDDPQDKAEKLYQICDSTEALSEVAKCIQGYLDEPSADYERAVDQMEHDIAYEPTYNSEDGSM